MPDDVDEIPATGEGDTPAAGDGEVESDSGPAPSPSSTVREHVIKSWTATCPNCGGALVHVASGVPSYSNGHTVVRCMSCGRSFLVTIIVTDVSRELGRHRRSHPEGCDCATCERGRRTHCPADHELSGDNLRVTSTGKRVCRTCERTWRVT